MEFHWWYIPVLLVVIFLFFGKRKGGVVEQRVVARMDVQDPRFEACQLDADYCTFRNEGPDHIEIEIEQLPLAPGETLEFLINGEHLADVEVNRSRQAEFDHWSDEGVDFPVVMAGDVLLIRYNGADVVRGVFELS